VRLIGGKSITFRLTLLFAAVSTTVLLLLGLIVGALLERHFEELDMELLTGKLALVQHALEKDDSGQALDALRQHLDDALVGHQGLIVSVSTPDGRRLFASGENALPSSFMAVEQGKKAQPTMWMDAQGRHYRGMSATVATGMQEVPQAIVAIATDMSNHIHFMTSFRTTLWSVVGLAALISGFLGWAAARRGLAPLRDIRQEAAEITANSLHHRLSVAAIPVELAEVAESLNAMLARLEASFRRLSDFSSDLAHELRTPVSNLLTQTQVILSRSRTPDEYRDVLASNAEEFERLSRMLSDMLFLAKSDNLLIVPSREEIDLRAEVSGVFEFYEALAEEKHIRLTLIGDGMISADRLMLRRAINNLLSNAVRHTPAGGSVTVRIDSIDSTDESATLLSVENTGDTIAAEHLPRLFDRFYRAEASRHRSSDGAGLGLAITQSIMRAHGGDAFAHSELGVTRFELRFPNSSRGEATK